MRPSSPCSVRTRYMMKPATYRRLAWLLMPLWLWVAAPAAAEVIRIDITSREVFGAGVASKIGPYERLRGRVVYALDPTDDANRRIVDLGLAIRGERGRVQFYGDIEIIAPVNLAQAQPTVLYVVNNRGASDVGVGTVLPQSRLRDGVERVDRPGAGDPRPAPAGGAGGVRQGTTGFRLSGLCARSCRPTSRPTVWLCRISSPMNRSRPAWATRP